MAPLVPQQPWRSYVILQAWSSRRLNCVEYPKPWWHTPKTCVRMWSGRAGMPFSAESTRMPSRIHSKAVQDRQYTPLIAVAALTMGTRTLSRGAVVMEGRAKTATLIGRNRASLRRVVSDATMETIRWPIRRSNARNACRC